MIKLLTYQDYEQAQNKIAFISQAVNEYMSGDEYQTAVIADDYDAQRNTTITNIVRILYSAQGVALNDYTAANNRIASNYFHRLNSQRVAYSLGNGITFSEHVTKRRGEDGQTVTEDATKDLFTQDFDTIIQKAGNAALKHGAAFLFLNIEKGKHRLHLFTAREFVPLYDETDGSLRAGIRFWSLDWQRKPATVVLYEEDGYTKYQGRARTVGMSSLEEIEPKRAYKLITRVSEAGGEEVVGEENYSGFPIVPLYPNDMRQSTLVGLRAMIDSYDLIMSGFANDLQDCAQVYWMVGNANGMEDADLEKFRDRLKFMHIATADLDQSSVTPYTQDIPHAARTQYLALIEDAIYSGFGAFSVKSVSAGSKTATEIDASYQPMDEEADAFEYQIIECLHKILALIGVEDTPVFKRNKISNQTEQTNMVISAAQYLDDETVLKKLPFIMVDEIEGIMANRLSRERENTEEIEETEEYQEQV